MPHKQKINHQVCRGCGNFNGLKRVGSRITCPICGNNWNVTPWAKQIKNDVNLALARKKDRYI